MFERIVLRRSLDGPAITAGEIAESLIFYQNVHIVLDYSSLLGLIRGIGMRSFLKLLSLQEVNATYIEDMTGTHTEQTPAGPEYSLITFRFSGDKDVGELKTKKERLVYALEREGYKKKDARKLVERFRRHVRYKNLSDNYYIPGGLISAARADLLDQDYVANGSRIIAQELLGTNTLPSDFFFQINSFGEKFRAETNINFEAISRVQQAKNPNAGEYTPANITSSLLNASIGLVFAGHYGGDFYTSESESRIIKLRQEHILNRFQIDRSRLTQFQEVVLQGSPSIVDVINRGDRSFEEFLELLSSARKFKHWLKGKSPDESLVAAYLEDITATGWLSRVPGKALRYVIGAAVGVIEPAAGLTLSAGDSFLLEKIVSGWRPNHFIESQMKSFVDSEAEHD